MENNFASIYRDQLAEQIKKLPKEKRRSFINEVAKSEEYLQAYPAWAKPRWNARDEAERKRRLLEEPSLTFDLENLEDLKGKLQTLAEYIYRTTNYPGGYDPYKEHMLCGQISDRLIEYLLRHGIQAKRVTRTYHVKVPDGTYYDDSFGHVYVTLSDDRYSILVDPTYLQFVNKADRNSLPTVLVIRYRDQDDLRRQMMLTAIKNPLVLPFYLGFDSEEAAEFFKDQKYEVISVEAAKIDD